MVTFDQKMHGIRQFLHSNRQKIAAAIPNRLIDPARLMRIIVTEVEKTPQLAECTPQSFWAAVVQVAQLGLEVGGPLGQAYFIPFNNRKKGCMEVQLVIGYKGFLDLVYRSERVQNVEAHVVREGDQFDFQFGTETKVIHRFGSMRGDPTHVYAVITMVNGGKHVEVMTVEEIEAVRQQSPGKDQDPWRLHWDEMAKKTVFRRAFKWTPKSAQDQRAVGLDEAAEAGIPQHLDSVIDPSTTVEDVADRPPAKKPAALADLSKKTAAVEKTAEKKITVAGPDGKVIESTDLHDQPPPVDPDAA
jgi:recombination protein RecT